MSDEHFIADEKAKKAQSEHLRVENLVAGYGKKQVLNSISLDVMRGQILAVIGHNGAGKSTLLKTIFGLLRIWEGKIFFNKTAIRLPNPREWLRTGAAYVPQGNRVFDELSVKENLEMGAVTLESKESVRSGIDRVFSFFPTLRSRLTQTAGHLSGGEKQMLALGNALILSPQLLLLDEPSLGLAPHLISEALGRIRQINRDSGTTVLIIEQKVREVLTIADSVVVLRNGRVSFAGAAGALKNDVKLKEVYL